MKNLRNRPTRGHDGPVGALVTLDLSDRSSPTDLPWIITFGPLDEDEEWEPVVCGPYERPHALALAEAVVADDDLMAVVEPLLPRVSVAEIRTELTAAQRAAEVDPAPRPVASRSDDDLIAPADLLVPDGSPEDSVEETPDQEVGMDFDTDEFTRLAGRVIGDRSVRPLATPGPDEIRAGFARIASRLTASG